MISLMTGSLDVKKTAFASGILLGLWHLMWSLLVAAGIAQSLYNWILALHFISLPLVITAFDMGTAITLVVVTTITGAVIGAVFAWLWNNLQA